MWFLAAALSLISTAWRFTRGGACDSSQFLSLLSGMDAAHVSAPQLDMVSRSHFLPMCTTQLRTSWSWGFRVFVSSSPGSSQEQNGWAPLAHLLPRTRALLLRFLLKVYFVWRPISLQLLRLTVSCCSLYLFLSFERPVCLWISSTFPEDNAQLGLVMSSDHVWFNLSRFQVWRQSAASIFILSYPDGLLSPRLRSWAIEAMFWNFYFFFNHLIYRYAMGEVHTLDFFFFFNSCYAWVWMQSHGGHRSLGSLPFLSL